VSPAQHRTGERERLATTFSPTTSIGSEARTRTTSNPRWDPQQTSPLLCNYTGDAFVLDASAVDPWFEKTTYAGTIDYRLLDPTQDWTTGWIYTNTAGGLGRTDINPAKLLVILSGPQLASATLSASNNYLLAARSTGQRHDRDHPRGHTSLVKATIGKLVIDCEPGSSSTAPRRTVVLTSDQDYTVGSRPRGTVGCDSWPRGVELRQHLPPRATPAPAKAAPKLSAAVMTTTQRGSIRYTHRAPGKESIDNS
jgi:hypothetical protein